MSTCESELIGASSGLAKALPHQLLMEEVTQASVGLVLGVDNTPAIRQVMLGQNRVTALGTSAFGVTDSPKWRVQTQSTCVTRAPQPNLRII